MVIMMMTHANKTVSFVVVGGVLFMPLASHLFVGHMSRAGNAACRPDQPPSNKIIGRNNNNEMNVSGRPHDDGC